MSKPNHHQHHMQSGQPTSHWDVAATPIDWVNASRYGPAETVGTSEDQVLPSALDIDQWGAYFPQTYAESPFQI